MLTNLYGSSHSYLQDLCSGNACNQAPTAYLQNMMVQQDHDSTHDRFHTQNIHIKDILSHGNVDVSLQELYGSSHSYLQNMQDFNFNKPNGGGFNFGSNCAKFGFGCSSLQNMQDFNFGFDNANGSFNFNNGVGLQELRRVQMDHDSSHDRFHTQNIDIKDINSHGNVDVSLQELYGSSHSYLMDMGAILDRIRARDHKIKAAIVSGFDHFKIDAKEAGERVGKDFKLAAKDVEWAGHKAWQGIEWCYHTLPCRKLVEKVGEDVVEDALEAALALQNLSFKSFVHNTEDRTEAFFKKHEASIEKITGGAFKGAASCAANDKCRATIKKYAEKYGLKAVEDGSEVAEDALQNLYGSSHSYLQDLSFGSFVHNAEDRTEAFFKKHEKSIKDITGGAFQSAAACAGNAKCKATIKKYAEKYGLKAVEDGSEVAEDALLQNLYGSSHSYMLMI